MNPAQDLVTVVTAWYHVKNKHKFTTFQKWMSYFFTIRTPIVVFTNKTSMQDLALYHGLPNVTVVVKEMDEFLTWRFRQWWELNVQQSQKYHPYITLDMNLIWNEKVNFVASAVALKLVTTPWVMWLDLGYFRCNQKKHVSAKRVPLFPNPTKLQTRCKPLKVYVGCVGDAQQRTKLKNVVLNRNEHMVPVEAASVMNDTVVAAGCLLLPVGLVPVLHERYYQLLQTYLLSGTYVKDDQTIFNDLVFSCPQWFVLVTSVLKFKPRVSKKDPWMIFQRFLL